MIQILDSFFKNVFYFFVYIFLYMHTLNMAEHNLSAEPTLAVWKKAFGQITSKLQKVPQSWDET